MEYNFDELRNDLIELINETIESGSSIEGGFSRAINEFWLHPNELDRNSEDGYLLRFLLLVSILSYRKELKLGINKILAESSLKLSKLITKQELLLIPDNDKILITSLLKAQLSSNEMLEFNLKLGENI